MQITAALWLLSPVIQLHETWSRYIRILDTLNVSPSVLCRLYIAARLGWLEPFFLLTSLLTFRYTVRRDGHGLERVEHCNRRIIGTALLSSVPVLGAQTLAALATVFSGDNDEDDSFLQERFLSTYIPDEYGCDGKREDHQDGCELCIFPLLSTLLSFSFVLYYLWRMWQVTMEMAQITLNHNLEQRICVFRNAVTGLLLLSLLCRGLSVIFDPEDPAFEVLRLGDFMSIVLVVAAASVMLVIRPVRDARMADKNVGDPVIDSAHDFLGVSELLIS